MDVVTDPDAAARLARRYPPPARSRWWIAVAIVLAIAGVAWLVWAGVHGAVLTVTARVDAFTVRSDSQIDVTVTIERPNPSQGAVCQLYAQAITYDRVGELSVTVPAGGQTLTRLEIPLRTFKRATTAVIDSCHVTT